MPRTRPDRTEEIRISLSNKERQFVAEQIQINSNKAWLGPLIGNFGTVVIGTGIVIGGYALWKWVGGFTPIETAKDAAEDFALWVGGGLYKFTTGESIETTVNRWLKMHQNKMKTIDIKCAERSALPAAIIADPNASDEHKAQAQRELSSIQLECDKQRAKEKKKFKEAIDNIRESLKLPSLNFPGLPPFANPFGPRTK
jgi:hypothetical protein